MIDPRTGEASFSDGLNIQPHMLLSAMAPGSASPISRPLPVAGWQQHALGIHGSDLGQFQLEVTTDAGQHIEAVFLRHIHPFYVTGTAEDSERRAFHEGIIARELRGQREFDWGHVFCRLDDQTGEDWLSLVYLPFAPVPLPARAFLQSLREHRSTNSN